MPGIHGGLQVVENRNSGNTVLFYDKGGDLTGPDREHAEVSMLALHLLQYALVHVNTCCRSTPSTAQAGTNCSAPRTDAR